MWIQVRTMDGKTSHRIDELSRLTKIEKLRETLVDRFDIPVDQQRLFYRGKELVDGHTLFDYGVQLNDIVQILRRQPILDVSKSVETVSDSKESVPPTENNSSGGNNSEGGNEPLSKYFKVGDQVEVIDLVNDGAWWEGKITNIKYFTAAVKTTVTCLSDLGASSDFYDDGFIYTVHMLDCNQDVDFPLHLIRPRSRKIIKFNEVKEGDKVMVNYNTDKPDEIGFWYDCIVTGKEENKTNSYLLGTVIINGEYGKKFIKDCKIKLIDEIFAIEKLKTIADEKTVDQENDTSKIVVDENDTSETVADKNDTSKTVADEKDTNEAAKSADTLQCKFCKDVPSVKCKECNCRICGGKDSPKKQVICDECEYSFHIWCLKPPLDKIPEGDWYCPHCKNDETEVVRPGEKLKTSKKKSKMASASTSAGRDWGKGMACVGRSKECTIVPPNHFGPIPGVEVGQSWKFRVQVSESGVHRPHVAGIHGRESEGAYSIVFSGGYEDDMDEGEEFYYTGSGGRDLSGNKRISKQSCDQTLTRMNKALAVNCKARVNKDGAEAEDWKKGKPIRVVRNYKGNKHSKYCPEEGNRYDGIYKVVKYWPEKGKSGFVVWRYLLRRDDPSPAPWTEEGQMRIEKLGLKMQYPDGYKESLESKRMTKRERDEGVTDSDEENPIPLPKKIKVAYEVPKEAKEFIKNDLKNKKLWDEILTFVEEGQQEFLNKVEISFKCVCCQELVRNPMTSHCLHNMCAGCLNRSFVAGVKACPVCRKDLNAGKLHRNVDLQKALLVLFPGYTAGR